jgi:hypothetical protein
MLFPPVLLADFAEYVDVSDRSEARARTTQQTSAPIVVPANPNPMPANGMQPAQTAQPVVQTNNTQFGVDFYTQPQLRLRMTDRVWTFTFGYLPSLTIDDIELGPTLDLFHTGFVGAAWHNRTVTLALTESATYGRFNSANVLPGGVAAAAAGGQGNVTGTGGTTAPMPGTGMAPAPANLQTLPAPITIDTLSTNTQLFASAQTDHRTRLNLGVGYLTSGGVGGDSLKVYPARYGPTAEASVNYALSRRDTSVTTARGFVAQFSSLPCISVTGSGDPTALCRPRSELVGLTQGIAHAVDRTTAFTAEAGVAYTLARNDDSLPYRQTWYPTGRIGVAHREGPKGVILLNADAMLVPFVDALTGTLTNFVQVQGLLQEPIIRTVILRTSFGGGQTIPTTGIDAATIIHGELEFAFLVGKQIDIAVGERGVWQRQAVAPAADMNGVPVAPETTLPFADFFSTVTYLAVTLRAPALRF